MIESFSLQKNLNKVEQRWRDKINVASEILGQAPESSLRPDPIHDRWRLDLMHFDGRLGIRGKTKADGSFDFYDIEETDSAHEDIVQMMDQWKQIEAPIDSAQLRFRRGLHSLRGLWIDTANRSINVLLNQEQGWLNEILSLGWKIEIGQKQNEFGLNPNTGRVELLPATADCWLPSFDHHGEEIALESKISFFSQPGPEANRALVAAGSELLDSINARELRWAEWGAGYGNLSAAFATILGRNAWISESDPAAFEVLERNQRMFFAECEVSQVRAESALQDLHADLWLVDPPRTGFTALLEQIEAKTMKAPRWVLAYHCHHKGLIADSRVLKTKNYRLETWISVDIFPATPYQEVVSLWQLS